MPIKNCNKDGKPGYSWGNTNKCWTYDPNNEASRKKARQNCIKQGYAEDPKKFKQEMASASERGDIADEEISQVILASIFDAPTDPVVDPSSEEIMMCDKCNQPMDYVDTTDMYICASCGNTKEKPK